MKDTDLRMNTKSRRCLWENQISCGSFIIKEVDDMENDMVN